MVWTAILNIPYNTIGDIRSQRGVLFVNGNPRNVFRTGKIIRPSQELRCEFSRTKVVDVQGAQMIGGYCSKQGKKKDIVHIAKSFQRLEGNAQCAPLPCRRIFRASKTLKYQSSSSRAAHRGSSSPLISSPKSCIKGRLRTIHRGDYTVHNKRYRHLRTIHCDF